ncbi:Receptor kinase-like protein Xa21 [Vitis vinifera]|uniref:Receptor kinase-like protein Xa21 n=1 Tax=Vitis vinifera TaxID=29760 RepID=A0A438D321_VITVI|nr:Receptor kinase-like protein Xa21 [Vitis vinifera]
MGTYSNIRNVRHTNLVKLICSCSETELGALVLPYMPNGSLEKWLYSENYCLNLFQRVSIMVDVASALEYLHHGLPDPVVHCDLNPSNVLLDNDMVAHVGDFGIAKILTHKRPATRSITLGTLGYVAPGKKPTDDMFSGELTLRQWVTSSISNKIMEVIDRKLLKTEDGGHAIATNCNLLAIFKLGLECSRELPEERIDIKEVVIKLDQIKWQMTNGN